MNSFVSKFINLFKAAQRDSDFSDFSSGSSTDLLLENREASMDQGILEDMDIQESPILQPLVDDFSISFEGETYVFPDFSFERQSNTIRFKKSRMPKKNYIIGVLLLLLVFVVGNSLPKVAALPERRDYIHYQKFKEFRNVKTQNQVFKRDGTNNVEPRALTKGSTECGNNFNPQDCEVLVDYTTSALIVSNNQLQFREGGCGNPIPQKPDGAFTSIIPCNNGTKFTYGDCDFFACEVQYGDAPKTQGTFESIGAQVIFTCRGEGNFILEAQDVHVNVPYKVIYQYTLDLPRGMYTVQWSCGKGLQTNHFYTSLRAKCKAAAVGLLCFNRDLLGWFYFFLASFILATINWFEYFNLTAWVLLIIFIFPFIIFSSLSKKESIHKNVLDHMKKKGICPLCGRIVSKPDYHLEHCPANQSGKTDLKDLSNWMTFRWLFAWASLISKYIDLFVVALLLMLIVHQIDVVGAMDVSKIIPADSQDCTPFDVGASSGVATFISNRVCDYTATPPVCGGQVDIDATLEGRKGFTQRYTLGDNLFLDIMIASSQYYYTVNRQYDACPSQIISESTSTCGGDKCDVCLKKIKPYTLQTSTPGTNEDACNAFGCIALQAGCTCASCTHQKTGPCYTVGKTEYKDTYLNIWIQSGGACKKWDIFMSSKSNNVLLEQLDQGDRKDDMVAVFNNQILQGTINALGQFGGFSDLKFKTDTDIECKDNQKYNVHCKFLHTKTYIYTSCCADSFSLKDQLQVRAAASGLGYQMETDTGHFRFIATIPNVPIQRNPSDVKLTLTASIGAGCYSCAVGAPLTIIASASGPGWFDVTADGANVMPSQINVNSGANQGNFTIYLGFHTGTVKIHVGPFSVDASYNLQDPGTDTVDTSLPDQAHNIEGTCGLFCGFKNPFNIHFLGGKILTSVLIALAVLLLVLSTWYIWKSIRRHEKLVGEHSQHDSQGKEIMKEQKKGYRKLTKNHEATKESLEREKVRHQQELENHLLKQQMIEQIQPEEKLFHRKSLQEHGKDRFNHDIPMNNSLSRRTRKIPNLDDDFDFH